MGVRNTVIPYNYNYSTITIFGESFSKCEHPTGALTLSVLSFRGQHIKIQDVMLVFASTVSLGGIVSAGRLPFHVVGIFMRNDSHTRHPI